MKTKTKTVKQPRQIPYSSLTAAEKRVRLARDIIADIESKRLVAARGRYLTVQNVKELYDEHEDCIITRDNLNRQCTVCAKAAIVVAAIDRFNHLEFDYDDLNYDKWSKSSDLYKWITKIFPKRDFAGIEIAFEGEIIGDDARPLSEGYIEKCKTFYDAKLSPQKQMIKIMKNIIKNNGKFTP